MDKTSMDTLLKSKDEIRDSFNHAYYTLDTR